MQDRKRHDKQDKFNEISKLILGFCFEVINSLTGLGDGSTEGQDMQDRKRHVEQDKFSEITKVILGVASE